MLAHELMLRTQCSPPLAELPPPSVRKAIRRGAHVSAEALAHLLGVSRRSVVFWESGSRPSRHVETQYRKALAALQEAETPLAPGPDPVSVEAGAAVAAVVEGSRRLFVDCGRPWAETYSGRQVFAFDFEAFGFPEFQSDEARRLACIFIFGLAEGDVGQWMQTGHSSPTTPLGFEVEALEALDESRNSGIPFQAARDAMDVALGETEVGS